MVSENTEIIFKEYSKNTEYTKNTEYSKNTPTELSSSYPG